MAPRETSERLQETFSVVNTKLGGHLVIYFTRSWHFRKQYFLAKLSGVVKALLVSEIVGKQKETRY